MKSSNPAKYVAPPQRLVYTFVEFYQQVYPCSRGAANNYVKNGELETFLDGGRRKVLVSKAMEFVARKAAAGGEVLPDVVAKKAAAGKIGAARRAALDAGRAVLAARKKKKDDQRTGKAAA